MRKTSTISLSLKFPAFRPGLGEKHPSKLLNSLRLLNTIDTPKTKKEHRHNGNAPSFIYYLKKSIRLG